MEFQISYRLHTQIPQTSADYTDILGCVKDGVAKISGTSFLHMGIAIHKLTLVLEDLLTAYERTADHCSNVAVEMLQVSEGKLEVHEYLNALKAGELHESVPLQSSSLTTRLSAPSRKRIKL